MSDKQEVEAWSMDFGNVFVISEANWIGGGEEIVVFREEDSITKTYCNVIALLEHLGVEVTHFVKP